jgi:hypothetical protein
MGCPDPGSRRFFTYSAGPGGMSTRDSVKKSSQLDLYLTDFQCDHPDRFRKKLRVSPLVFDCLVELIDDHVIFHNNSNIPQHPPAIQLAIFLVRVGHYGNASAPKYVAQWAGVCVGTVINATYRCLVAFLALHDEAIMMPPEEEKERAKEYVEGVTCPEWRNGFYSLMGQSSCYFKSLGYMGRRGLTRTKTTQSTVRYVSEPLQLHTDSHSPDH